MNRMIYHCYSIKILFLTTLLLALATPHLRAQLQATGANTPAFNPQTLISNIFLGEGVEVTNITFNGDNAAVGYFTGGTSTIGIERGIVMTTGRAATGGGTFGCDSDGSNFAGSSNGGGTTEPSLGPIVAPNGLNDVAVYTITFIPTSDTLRFRYIFGSEEYPEFACSPYNDVFGFFISGPGYPTPTNIAIIPGTNPPLPVTINNIHPNNPAYFPCPPKNAQFYNNNNNSNARPTYDGYTDVFTAEAIVEPCQEYTIKLAIADAGDSAYDSGVFLEAKSFGTGSLRTDVATVSLDGTVTEGCAQGTVTFTLPLPATQNTAVDYNVWGTATNGVDIQLIPAGLQIPAGQTQLVLPIVALEDNLAEGSEFIAIDVQRDPCNRDTVYLYLRENTLLAPELRPDTTICANSLVELNGTSPSPVPQPTTFTNTQDLLVDQVSTPFISSISVFGVQPTLLDSGVIRSVCLDITHPFDDDLDIFLISPGGQFIELTTDNGGAGDNYTQTCFTPAATQPITYGFLQAPALYAPFTGDFKPEGVWSDLWGGPTNGTWKLQVVDDSPGFPLPGIGRINEWSITFEPSYKINYQWTPGNGLSCPTCPITDATTGQTTQYIINATDSYGCVAKDTVALDVQPVLPPPAIVCGNSSSSTVTFEWDTIPGSLGYEININGSGWVTPLSDTSHTVTGLAPSSVVNVEVRGINSIALCSAEIAAGTCVNCVPPQVTVATTAANCATSADGSVTFTPDGQNPPYSFRVGTVSNTTGIFTDLLGGSYVGTVTDGSGCDTLIGFVVPAPPALAPTATVQQTVSCFGGTDGALSVAVTGGVGPYTLVWSDAAAQTATFATALTAGTYTVTVTDNQNCTATSTATVTEPTDLLATAQKTDATCFGTATGSLSSSGSGGTAPYTYAWPGGLSGPNVSNVAAGMYTVTITDAKNCSEVAFVTVDQPAQLTATTTLTPTTCSASTDGTATVAPVGGTTPYAFVWDNTAAQTAITATNLSAQTYTVTVTDALNCTVTATASITSPPALTATVVPTPTSCSGGNDGEALVTATGGNDGGYTYLWSAPNVSQLNPNPDNLAAGTYTVTVKDSKGCTFVASTVVPQPDPVLVSGTTTPASCFGFNDGRIKTIVTGGTQPYDYTWSSGDQQTELNDKPAGTYTVTVTDNNGCTGTLSLTVTQPTAIVTAFTPSPVLCYNGSSGSIQTQVVGGGGGYTIQWNGPNNFISNEFNPDTLFAGAYNVTVTDASNCTVVEVVNINQPAAPLSLTAPLISDTICFQGTNGVAQIFPSGGTTPYYYTWNDSLGQTTQFPQNLDVDLYRVTVTDANGCYAIDSTFIVQRGPLFAYVLPTLPRCFDGEDGFAEVTFMSYGVNEADISLFDYVWSNGQTGTLATGLSAEQVYTVSVNDANGCTAVQAAIIGNQPELLAAFNQKTDVLCFGGATGQLEAAGNGGNAPYTYFWSPNVGSTQQTNVLVDSLAIGSYRVTITDANGCQTVGTSTLTQPPVLASEFSVRDVLCFAESTGQVGVQMTGGVAPYTYLWDLGATTALATQLPAGMTTVTVTDANGCLHIDSVEVRQPTVPLAAPWRTRDVVCYGGRDGQVELTPTGGTPPYRYSLNQSPWNGSPLQIGLQAGVYDARVQDANGCIFEVNGLQINQRDAVEVDLGPDISIELGESAQLLATITNGLPPYQIFWSQEDSLWLSCLDCIDPFVDSLYYANTFEVYVIDSLGCLAEASIRVLVDKPRRIFVPTGFTPNGDITNDLLLVHGQETAKILEFRVYDRWGEMVFQANNFTPNDPAMGWDGSFRGKDMLPGVYVWTVEVEYLDGVKELLHGQTTLIR